MHIFYIIKQSGNIRVDIASADLEHFRSSEQHTDNCVRLAVGWEMSTSHNAVPVAGE